MPNQNVTPGLRHRATRTRAIATLAGLAFVTSALTASEATVTSTPPAPRTMAIAWAQCNYGLETRPMPPLIAVVFTSDGTVVRTHARSTTFDDARAESAVIGPKRFRAMADGLDRSTLFDPPPKPSPGVFVPGNTDPTDIRRTQFAVRRDGEWIDWSIYREYTKSEKAAVWATYAVVSDPKLAWRPAVPRANAFAVCKYDAPRDAMTIPASASTSMWGVSEIAVADCHHVPEDPGAPPVRAYRLMRSGWVARTTADAGDPPVVGRTERAKIGSKAFADFAARLEKAGFFQKQDASAGVVVKDTGSERLSALRDDRLTTWSSERSSSRRNYSDIMSAIVAAASNLGLLWSSAPRDDNAFSTCTE